MKHVLVLPVFAICAGCLSPVTSGVSAEGGRLSVENRAFASRLEIVRDQTTMSDKGFLKAQVTLRNRESRSAAMQYRFVWKDSSGMVMKSAETVWTPLPLHGREEAVLEAVCPVPGAADFRLVVRPM